MSAVVQKVIKGQHMLEGAGVRICRTIGTSGVRVDPFLMLDELKLPAGMATAGFPDHPHRGMATCTIMKSGRMEHKDSIGNSGIIKGGGVQWMEAARGIIHSEIPVADDPNELLHGFQLWVNLPARHKMGKPRYQDLQADAIPEASLEERGNVRVLAGEWNGTTGPIQVHHSHRVLLLDVSLDSGSFSTTLASRYNCFCYVYSGSGKVADKVAEPQTAYVLASTESEQELKIEAGVTGGLKCLVVAGEPINEPVAQHGPFVMNTARELEQAFSDYHSGHFARDDIE